MFPLCRPGAARQPSQGAVLCEYASMSPSDAAVTPLTPPPSFSAGRHCCHSGDAQCGGRGGRRDGQRRRRDAHEPFERPPAKPEPAAAVCHLHKHAVPPEHSGHGSVEISELLSLLVGFIDVRSVPHFSAASVRGPPSSVQHQDPSWRDSKAVQHRVQRR